MGHNILGPYNCIFSFHYLPNLSLNLQIQCEKVFDRKEETLTTCVMPKNTWHRYPSTQHIFLVLFFCVCLFSLSFSITYSKTMQKILSHKLTPTDVKHRLAVPIQGLPDLPRFEGDARAQPLTMEDEEGKKWDFLFRIGEGKHKKPEFSTGWVDFVRSKKLGIGHEIHFFKEEDEATGVTRYMIKAQKELKLFGTVIGCVPYADQADR